VPVSKPLSYLLAAGLACRDLPRQANWDLQCEYELEWINEFDDSFDEFWSEFTTKHRGLLLSGRTAELLRWHFRYALQRGRAWIQAARDGERLVAYATFLRQDNAKFNLKRIRLVDYQALDRTPKLLAPMIARALERCRQGGIHMLEWIGLPHDPTALSSLRPLRRKLPSWMYFYRANRSDLKAKLANPTAWAPSSFDGDSSL
jgi:hypothetical protein